MPPSFPFRHLEPTFFSGLLDDPVLLVRVRPMGSNLLFDCGQIHHLAKKALSAIDAVFISHAHMDHWMGIGTVIRHLLASSKTIDLFGPAGIAEKFAHQLAAYDWNLAEDFWCSFRVHDIYPDHIECSLFEGAKGFRRQVLDSRPRDDRVIYSNRLVQVEATACDHRIESLIFRVSERPLLKIDNDRLETLGLDPGPWLKELKYRYAHPDEAYDPLPVRHRTKDGFEERLIEDVTELCQRIGRPRSEHAIGYISDVGFTSANRERIVRLLKGVQLLICECTFLADARPRARSSNHLCTTDVNRLLEDLRPAFFLPMHLSKTYRLCPETLYQEIEPPIGTRVLKLPLHATPAPLRAEAMSWQELNGDRDADV